MIQAGKVCCIEFCTVFANVIQGDHHFQVYIQKHTLPMKSRNKAAFI